MAYANNALITVDNTKVSGSSNLSNFPILISGTYDGTAGEPDLRSAANGGDIENVDTTGGNSGVISVPADLAFYDDADQTTQYDHEIEEYDATTGKFSAWVRIPTLLYNSDTTLYMFYGDSGVTTSQENINGVWDSNYVGVWHCNNNPATGGTIYDSTSTPANMTTQHFVTAMEAADLIDAKVSKGLQFEKSKEQYMITATSVSKLNFTTQSYTLEAVVNLNTLASVAAILLAHGDGTVYWQYYFTINTNGTTQLYSNGGGNLSGSATVSTGTDYYKVGVRDGTTGRLYHNGATDGTGNSFGNPSSRTDSLFHAYNNYSPAHHHLDGKTSELRVSNIARSADWIATTYETLMNPSTFYTIGSDVGGTITPQMAMIGHGT